jgi:glycine dehydrogenase subunit 2
MAKLGVVLAAAVAAYSDPEIVRTAPHNQAIAKLGPANLDDPDVWATTWRAHKRKAAERAAAAAPSVS